MAALCSAATSTACALTTVLTADEHAERGGAAGVYHENPMRAVSPPKKRQREAKLYTPEQPGILLDKAVGTRLELPVFICAYLGLRRGELCGLRWSDVDLEHQTITIENARTQAGKKEIEKGTKTASSTRTLYLPDTLCDMLKAAREHQQACRAEYKNAYDDNDYVVVMEDGRPFRPNYLSELFGKLLADNDLPKIVLHELRHTFASLSNQQAFRRIISARRSAIPRRPPRRRFIRICSTRRTRGRLKVWPLSRMRRAARQARNIFYSLRRRLLMKSACGTR
ncbi:site-specific integrase [Agathobaculum sp.]|uniref:site-specific integrase n=1 Tax=Agathobaculum sp. TaxID=2048138 RepID=UPI003AB37F22